LNIVESSGNYVFEGENPPPPTTPRVRFVSYALGAHKLSMGRVVVEISKKAYSIGN
jgi:hypothetical protein